MFTLEAGYESLAPTFRFLSDDLKNLYCGKEKEKKIMSFLVATNVCQSAIRLECRMLVPILDQKF